ncbi:carboxypeptidase-like regulatory domain-containing protein [Paludibaculum fermentans]|uniref:Carboxypeptidase regulatory-like domain-containing protein n=1 Tax=Paludibaculum fermentans TaxID=1473598 RepID=A0A7S7SJS7_PALFE|nr:carboxypeptidase-like regulatory domain-containing protein [Paludibaculum fermentans]QOY88402.1 carboxypeptidase regulatory-like domain-containing protein [Paludibaculum fermentans]
MSDPRWRFALLLLTSTLLRAQSGSTGALEGTVLDAAGAPVPNASITIHNPATDQSLTATTDEKGGFRFSLLEPATYEITFTTTGFKTARMPQMAISVSEIPVLEATLEPGNPAESIDCHCKVTAAAPSTGTLIDRKTITAVPLNTRNFTQVLSMSSGSAAGVNNAGTLGRGSSSVNINGNTTAGAYTIDGAYSPSTVPNPDTISEFKIQTSQYDAGYGAMVPSTNLVTRRGENEIHGNMWEFLRNDIFNANSYFRGSTGQDKPNLKQNQFGATLGGPVRRNKWFFFGSYQGTRQVNGIDPTSIANLILPPLGNDRSASALAAQFCPGNHSNPAAYLSFAGGRQLDCNNQNTGTTAAISPVALRLLQAKAADGSYLIPIPQTIMTSGSNAGLGFSAYSQPSFYREKHFLANSDYVLSPKHTFSGRLFTATVDQLRTFGSPGGYPGAPVVPGWGANQALTATDIATSGRLTSNLTANLVNEATFAFTRNNTDAVAPNLPKASDFGMTAVDPLFPHPPEITVLGGLGTFRLFGTNPNDNHFKTVTNSVMDNLSWVHGRQRIRVGGAYVNQYNGRADTGGARGKLTFQTFADFLLGMNAADNLSPAGRSNIQTVQASEGVGQFGDVEYHYRRHYGSAYFQDDIKLSPRLTVNFGLRWEFIGPSYDTTGTIGNASLALLRQTAIPPADGTLAGNTVSANYDPNLVNPYTGSPFGPPPQGVIVRPNSSFYENGTPRDRLAPRTGFAWHPFGASSRLVLGGGYGWFYQTPTFSANAATAPLFTAVPFAQSFTNSDASNSQSTFQQPFPQTTLGYVPRTLTSQLSDRLAGPEYKLPRLQQWNFSVKTRLTQAMSFDLAYVGSRAGDLLFSHGMNQSVLAGPSNPVNCGYDGDSSHCITTNTSKNAKQRVPILGETPTALVLSEFGAKSWYHSMQATLRGRTARGLTFQSAYTLSKAMNNTSVFNDQNNLELAKARASFDRTHRVITNFDYNLPAFLGTHGFRGSLLSGWSLSGIVVLQSGLPMTLTDPNGGSVYGRAGTSTVTLCPGATYSQLVTPGGIGQRLDRWINTGALCSAAAVGSDGSTGYGTAGQSIMNGPGQVNTDFSLGKRTRVGGLRETAELGFRMEFYNAMNHPQFSNPGTTLGTASFGVITQSAVAPRLIQFGLKYQF